MKSESENLEYLEALFHKSCDGTLSESERNELQRALLDSDTAAQSYIQLRQVWCELLDLAELEVGEDGNASRESPQVPVSIPISIRRRSFWLGLGSIAALLVLSFAIGATVGRDKSKSSGQQIAKIKTSEEAKSGSTKPEFSAPSERFVARVVEVSQDAEWGDNKPREFLLRLAVESSLDLLKGEARVEFGSGASVILHGPTKFQVVAANVGRLLQGRITGHAENGNFRLHTEMADVIDLGTEFGVSVDSGSGADVCVFDGEVHVDVRADDADPAATGEVRLTEGMAVRVGLDGRVDDAAEVNRDAFTRYKKRAHSLAGEWSSVSLVDLISGGDGRHARLAGAIDPRSGGWDTELVFDQEANRHRDGNSRYQINSDSPFIDGVFVPVSDGGLTTTNSAGGAFDFGKTEGFTWGPIWSRRPVPNLRASDTEISDFWGTDTLPGILNVIDSSEQGVVGLHANVGVTFDLRAVRMFAGQRVARFQTEIENLDNSKKRPPAYAVDYRPSVDFWVIVDDRVIYKRADFGRDGGRVAIDVPLNANDRFLTLVSTDAGNTFSFDHLVLIDPSLLFESP